MGSFCPGYIQLIFFRELATIKELKEHIIQIVPSEVYKGDSYECFFKERLKKVWKEGVKDSKTKK